MKTPLRINTASESEKFKATKGKKWSSLGSTSAGSLQLSQATKPGSSGFRKGKYTLDVKTVQSKMQFCIRIKFHAAFTSQHKLEAKQRQMTETNGGRRAVKESELYPMSLVCCCQSLAALPFIWQITARIRLFYNSKYVYLSYKLKI